MTPPISIDGTDITGATIDGQDVQEITVDGQTVFSAQTLPVAYSNLVAWYPFENGAQDETAGDQNSGDSSDYSGTVNGGSIDSGDGVTDINNGVNSFGYDKSGSNSDSIDLSNAGFGTQSFSNFTVMGWIYVTGTNSNLAYLWANLSGNQGDNNGTNSFMLRYNGGDMQYYNAHDGNFTLITNAPMNQNEWYHAAMTNDSNTLRAFLDGTEVGTASSEGPTNNLNLSVIGNFDRDLDRAGDGFIDDCRMYNMDLSPSEINQIYDNTKPSTKP